MFRFSATVGRTAGLLLFLSLLADCTDTPVRPTDDGLETISAAVLTLDPTGVAPLSARLHVVSEKPVGVSVRVAGLHGPESDVIHAFPATGTDLELAVLGLYAGRENTVEATFRDAGTGAELGTRTFTLATRPLLSDLPRVEIDAADPARMIPGMTLVAYYGYRPDGSATPQRPFIFDRWGDIRWYLDFRSDPTLGQLFYDNGMERLRNGNLFFGDNSTSRIYEIDMLGTVLNSWDMPGFQFHHNVIEKPDGNFLATASMPGIGTTEDFVVEIGRGGQGVVRVWDLRQSLDPTRRTWETDLTDEDVDWFHGNAVAWDPDDRAILVSGRHQGVVKLTEANQVVWILAPHRGWAAAGDGTDLSTRLLQPLDDGGRPITDPDVLAGDAEHPDFGWAWYQHAVKQLPNGHVLLFDNGENRRFGRAGRYSRAVEYAIDDDARTVRQVWAWGRQLGEEAYSRIVSDVDYVPADDHVFFSPGAVETNGHPYGRVFELERGTRDVVFQATVRPPVAAWGITFHRTERMSLYPGDAGLPTPDRGY